MQSHSESSFVSSPTVSEEDHMTLLNKNDIAPFEGFLSEDSAEEKNQSPQETTNCLSNEKIADFIYCQKQINLLAEKIKNNAVGSYELLGKVIDSIKKNDFSSTQLRILFAEEFNPNTLLLLAVKACAGHTYKPVWDLLHIASSWTDTKSIYNFAKYIKRSKFKDLLIQAKFNSNNCLVEVFAAYLQWRKIDECANKISLAKMDAFELCQKTIELLIAKIKNNASDSYDVLMGIIDSIEENKFSLKQLRTLFITGSNPNTLLQLAVEVCTDNSFEPIWNLLHIASLWTDTKLVCDFAQYLKEAKFKDLLIHAEYRPNNFLPKAFAACLEWEKVNEFYDETNKISLAEMDDFKLCQKTIELLAEKIKNNAIDSYEVLVGIIDSIEQNNFSFDQLRTLFIAESNPDALMLLAVKACAGNSYDPVWDLLSLAYFWTDTKLVCDFAEYLKKSEFKGLLIQGNAKEKNFLAETYAAYLEWEKLDQLYAENFQKAGGLVKYLVLSKKPPLTEIHKYLFNTLLGTTLPPILIFDLFKFECDGETLLTSLAKAYAHSSFEIISDVLDWILSFEKEAFIAAFVNALKLANSKGETLDKLLAMNQSTSNNYRTETLILLMDLINFQGKSDILFSHKDKQEKNFIHYLSESPDGWVLYDFLTNEYFLDTDNCILLGAHEKAVGAVLDHIKTLGVRLETKINNLKDFCEDPKSRLGAFAANHPKVIAEGRILLVKLQLELLTNLRKVINNEMFVATLAEHSGEIIFKMLINGSLGKECNELGKISRTKEKVWEYIKRYYIKGILQTKLQEKDLLRMLKDFLDILKDILQGKTQLSCFFWVGGNNSILKEAKEIYQNLQEQISLQKIMAGAMKSNLTLHSLPPNNQQATNLHKMAAPAIVKK